MAATLTEKELLGLVRECAKLRGWLCYHTHYSARSEAGFVDCCLVRGNRLIFAELKSDSGRLTDAQRWWFTALEGTAAECYVWRPSSWTDGTIDRCLS